MLKFFESTKDYKSKTSQKFKNEKDKEWKLGMQERDVESRFIQYMESIGGKNLGHSDRADSIIEIEDKKIIAEVKYDEIFDPDVKGSRTADALAQAFVYYRNLKDDNIEVADFIMCVDKNEMFILNVNDIRNVNYIGSKAFDLDEGPARKTFDDKNQNYYVKDFIRKSFSKGYYINCDSEAGDSDFLEFIKSGKVSDRRREETL